MGYFKQKMAALKDKRKRFSAEGVTIDFKRENPTEIKKEVVGDGTDEKPFFRGFSAQGVTQFDVTIEKLQEREFTEIKEEVDEKPIVKTDNEKKKKKKRKSTNKEEIESKSSEEEPQKSNIETVDGAPVIKKKKKKSSKEKVEELDTSVNTTTEIFENIIKDAPEEKKKKKKI